MNTELQRPNAAPSSSSGDDLARARRMEAIARLLALPKGPGVEPDWSVTKQELLDTYTTVKS